MSFSSWHPWSKAPERGPASQRLCETSLDRAQLHVPGDLGANLPVLRALRPAELQAADQVAAQEWILIDGSEGRGVSFDWNLARTLIRPFVLAGGLTPENVVTAIRAARPAGVDVTTGVELTPGRKDPDKLARFIANARLAFAG